MEQFRKRQYLLGVLILAVVLSGALAVWQQQSRSLEPAGPVPVLPVDNAAPEPAAEIVVYVSGFVVRPGVYALAGTPRAIDCVNAAGGFAGGADTAAVNLAQKVRDGMQIHVPGSLASAAAAPAAGAARSGGKVSLNQADKQQLESLPGIGPALADRILEYRATQGSFQAIEDLKNVSGIGAAKYNALKDKVSL